MGGDDPETIREGPGKSDFHGPAFNGGFKDPSVETSGILAYSCILGLQGSFSLRLRNTVAGDVFQVLTVPLKEHPPLPKLM
jgi:hypothetical protein